MRFLRIRDNRAAKDPTAAAELVAKQIADGERKLQASPKTAKVRVSAAAYRDAERLFKANQMARGPKPQGASSGALRELLDAGVVQRDGHARGTRYTLLKRPSDLFCDPIYAYRSPEKRLTTARTPQARPISGGAVLTIGASEKAYIREHVREYLAFATSVEARKHEERRQSEGILDQIHSRAKELLRTSRQGVGPRLTPLEASRHAQLEIAIDFEQLLKVRWLPIMFEIFGMLEIADTDMRTIRNAGEDLQ